MYILQCVYICMCVYVCVDRVESCDGFMVFGTYTAEPGFYTTNWLFIGKSYLRLGKKAEAKEWLQKTADHISRTADDEEVRPSASLSC